jgi:hypothetical protein
LDPAALIASGSYPATFAARGRRRIARNPAAIAATIAQGRVGMFVELQCAIKIAPLLKRNSSRGASIPDDMWHRRPIGQTAFGFTSALCLEPVAFSAGNQGLICRR